MLIVFAKAPLPGRVKTRLIPALGAAGAARLHERLLLRTLDTALAARCGRIELHCAPDWGNPLFRTLARRHGARLRSQEGADIGERMLHSFRDALSRADAAVLIGTDCPVLGPSDLRRAFTALNDGADAVLAPAEDGGYPLIGLRRVSPDLFQGIEWGGSGVMQATRERLRRLGWRWRELRMLWDVDRPADVARLRRQGYFKQPPTS